MIDDPRRAEEVAAYKQAVAAHLGDLPAHERAALMADLEAHLTEVAADLEPEATLIGRIGMPADYARELREAVRVEGDAAESLSATVRARAAANAAADRYTRSAGAGPALLFWKSLRPGWWVLRGLLVAALIVYALFLYRDPFEFPFGSTGMLIATLVLAPFCVWASLWLGSRSNRMESTGRVLVVLGGIALVAIAWSAFNDFAAGPALEQDRLDYDEMSTETPWGEGTTEQSAPEQTPSERPWEEETTEEEWDGEASPTATPSDEPTETPS